MMAKALVLSLEAKGDNCFPDSNTNRHIDNKIFGKDIQQGHKLDYVINNLVVITIMNRNTGTTKNT